MGRLRKPIADARAARGDEGGLYVDGDDPMGPEGPTEEEAIPRSGVTRRSAPVLSVVPLDTPSERLRVRHPGYDVRAAVCDHNLVFPIDRLKELADE